MNPVSYKQKKKWTHFLNNLFVIFLSLSLILKKSIFFKVKDNIVDILVEF